MKKRQQLLQRELNDIVAQLAHDESIVKVVVFGSFARGESTDASDLDIAVIQDTGARYIDRLKQIALQTRPSVGVDFVVYTPSEYRQLRQRGHYFLREIERGKTLYERSATRPAMA